MGRKSKTKKLVREMIKDKDGKLDKEKAKKQIKKNLTKSSKKKTSTPQKKAEKKLQIPKEFKLKIKNRKVVGFILAALFTITLFTFAYFIFLRAFRPVDVAKYLPAEKVVMLAEININPQHNQVQKALDITSKKTGLDQDGIINLFNSQTPYNFDADIAPWIGRKIAIVSLLDNSNQTQNFIFAEYSNAQAVEEFQTKHPNAATVIDSYLVFGTGSLLEELGEPESPLSSDDQYRKSLNNLPYQNLALLYINFQNLNDNFINSIPILKEQGISLTTIKPLLSTLKTESLAVLALEDNFVLQSYLGLNTDIIDNAVYLKRHQKYHGDLIALLGEDTLAFWGGENLEIQLRRILEILTAGNKNEIDLFDRLISSYTEKYFGPDINFNQDILPLFRNEFLFALSEQDSKQHYKFILELDSPKDAAQKLHEIANSFASMGAVFEPKVVSHTLPDGTESKEIVAVPEKILKSNSTHNDTTIFELKMGTQKWGIYYAMIDNIAIFSSSKDQVISSLDLYENSEGSLAKNDIYQTSILPVLRNADEVSFLDLHSALPLLFNTELPQALAPIKALSTGRSYFNDGIITINYLDLN